MLYHNSHVMRCSLCRPVVEMAPLVTEHVLSDFSWDFIQANFSNMYYSFSNLDDKSGDMLREAPSSYATGPWTWNKYHEMNKYKKLQGDMHWYLVYIWPTYAWIYWWGHPAIGGNQGFLYWGKFERSLGSMPGGRPHVSLGSMQLNKLQLKFLWSVT